MKKVYFVFSFIFIVSLGYSQYATKMDAKMQRVSKPTLSELQITPATERSTKAVIFSEGFEWTNMPENGWTTLDQDGDGNNWFVYTAAGSAHTGAKSVASASWYSGNALNPNNWLITPQITLPASGTIMLGYWIGAQEPAWPNERYKVAISTTNTNPSSFTIIHAETLTSGGWKERIHNLSAYAGQNVYIAFIHTECTDMFYLKLDDVSIYTNETIDGAILGIIEPNHSNGCTLSSAQDITVRIQNNGGSNITNFQVSYSINGGPAVTETVTATVAPASTYDFTFATKADMSALQNYHINATLTLAGDSNTSNDVAELDIVSGDALIEINAFTDEFGGQSWQVINKLNNVVVAERTVGWQWNVTVNEQICVISDNCYKVIVSDEDGMEDPAWVTISYNGTVVAGSTTPGSFTGPQLIADNLGNGCAAIDAAIISIYDIYPLCELGNEQLKIVIKNEGTDPISNFQISYSVNSGAAVNETYTGTIISGQEIEYTFTQTIDMSTDGIYEIEVTINVAGDGNPSNNSMTTTTANLDSENVPYSSNFDTQESLLGWIVYDANMDDNSWVYASGYGVNNSNALAYVYSSTEPANDWVFSTCIDLVGGQAYRVNLDYKVQSASYPEKLAIYYGNTQEPTSMNLIVDLGTLSNTTYQTANSTFTPSASGTYYFGMKAYSDADMWYLFIDNFAVDVVTSNEIINNASVSVYPNPAKDYVTIANAEGANIVIVNMLGSVVANVNNASANQIISTADLANGTYFVKVNNEVFKLNIIK